VTTYNGLGDSRSSAITVLIATGGLAKTG